MRPRKVLIVDDDPAVRKGLKRLVQAAGYEVEVFAGAGEYLARESPAGPACLVVDVKMPVISGLELMRLIDGTPRALPVVLITGHADDAIRATARASGAVAVLDKPVEEAVLLEAIERGLSRSA
jgi:FixJ family two-component response regulator